MHADIGKELLAGILQAATKDVDHIVDDEETVEGVKGTGTFAPLLIR